MAELSDRIDRFMDAIAESMRIIRAGEASLVIDAVIAERWPGKDPALLRRAADQMARGGVWDSAAIDRDASDRWMRILEEGGLVSHAPTLDELTGARRADVAS
jgi:NitT/TauT family transport system substrate-binding protein